jgi:hypothetical protein
MDREAKYNELCDKADALLAQYNPCEIKDGKCKRGYFCCDGCIHLVNNSCSIRSLLCKVWICDVVSKTVDKQLIDDLRLIYNEGLVNNMIIFRGDLNSIADLKAQVQMPWGPVYSIPR